ncbi:MAG: DUF421 domain-containing protein, partial [Clostridiales bacterium]|nr:DUF421 domain-containing protein [Clostridiales bacterium]
AMAVYALATLGFALLSDKSIVLRRFFEGVPIVLMENGRIYEKNFAKAKIDISEFLMRCRAEGYFDLCDIDTAVFEANGTLSVLAKAGKSPVKAEEMGIAPGRAGLNAAVIIDGRIMKKNLANIGYDAAFLRHKLKNMNVKISDVFYASCNAGGDVCVFERTNAYPKGKLE